MPRISFSLKYSKFTISVSYMIVEAHPPYSHTARVLGKDVCVNECARACVCDCKTCSSLCPQVSSVFTFTKASKV